MTKSKGFSVVSISVSGLNVVVRILLARGSSSSSFSAGFGFWSLSPGGGGVATIENRPLSCDCRLAVSKQIQCPINPEVVSIRNKNSYKMTVRTGFELK